jgi:hypothetical protein
MRAKQKNSPLEKCGCGGEHALSANENSVLDALTGAGRPMSAYDIISPFLPVSQATLWPR